MNKAVVVKLNEQVLYKGNILDLPIKNEKIIEKSIELFADDDPCIIHKSYVIKAYIDQLLSKVNSNEVKVADLMVDFLELPLDAVIYFGG